MPSHFSIYAVKLLERIQEFFQVDQCWILLYDDQSDRFTLELEYKMGQDIQTSDIIVLDDVAKKIFYEQTPLLSNQIISDCKRWSLSATFCAKQLFTKPFVGVPIRASGKIIGVTALQSGAQSSLTEKDSRILQLIAGQWATECENGQLEEMIRHRIHKFENLYRLSTHLMSTHETKPLMQMIIDYAIQAVPNAEKGSLLLYNAKNQKLEVLAQHGYTDEYISHFSLPVGKGYSGIAFQEQRDLVVPDMLHPDAKRFLTDTEHSTDAEIKSAITTILKYQNKLIGTISLENFSFTNAFKDDDLRLLSLFASQAAMLIENANLLESIRKHTTELEILYQFNSRIINLRHQDEILLECLTSALHGIPAADRGYLLFRNTSSGKWTIPFQRGIPSERLPDVIRSVEETHIGWAILQNHGILFSKDRPDSLDQFTKLQHAYPLRTLSSVVTFFTEEDYITGALVIESSKSSHAISPDDLKLCSALTSRASVALQNIKWYSTLERKVDDRTRQLRELNERILETDRLKSQFLSNISHELRTPLNAVIGFSELLLDKVLGNLNSDQEDCLEDIHASGKHLLNIINDILDLSKIQAGKMDLFMEDFLLADIISSVERGLASVLRNKEQRIVARIPENFPMVHADIKKFKQILSNLISNASKYSPPQSAIEIDAEIVSEDPFRWIQISVTDHGKGINPEHLNIIFDEFRQADGSHTREDSGTGLGLALCRHLVELQGGNIRVTSEPGKGSRFYFRIPVETSFTIEGANGIHQAAHGTSRSKRVLVVEDDSISAGFLKKFMETEGYEVHVVHLGEYVVSEAKRIQPMVITLDIMLPGINGWQVLQELKSDPQTANIPVLIVSATDDDHVFRIHAHDYFVKPVERDKLLSRIKELSELGTFTKEIRNILIVDDDKGFLMVTGTLLERQGFTVYKASSGPEALELLKSVMPDVVLLDLLMPGMNGVEVIEQIKQNPNTQHLPIVILTAANLTKKDTQTLEGKIQGLIEKTSYQPEDLAVEIRRLIN